MSYNQKPPGSSGSGIGGGPPNGPNNIPQVAKTFAGIQQQMQNLVHGQNAIPQSSQADINAFLQQQRIQNMLKQQQQFLQFQHQMQQQQQHQQQHQHHNMASAGGVGSGPVGGVPGVGAVVAAGGGGSSGSGEPLALTRTAGAAELLNKTYQQQANGNPAANPTFNQLQQTLQSLPTNFVQHLQVFQYQMQAKQMQQQQHGGGQGQHGHGQQQPAQGVPPPPSATPTMPHQQQQQQQQKHQNQHQQQQQQNALSRYLTAAAAQAAAVSGNKLSSATPPPPPLTNQMKPPNLPPNTQITPVTAANMSGGNISASPHSKMSTGNTNAVSAKHPAPPPSISLTPSKTSTSSPSAAHQQNKFTPPTNSGAKGGHLGHSQNLSKSTHGASHTATSNTASPSKAAANADATVASLKSPQSTPVQLTKQMPLTTNTAAIANKPLTNSTTTTTGSTSTVVSPLKSATTSVASPTTSIASTPIAAIPSTTAASNVSALSTSSGASGNANSSKPSTGDSAKPPTEEPSATKLPTKSANTEKETDKSSSNDTIKPTSASSEACNQGNINKETQKMKESKLETEKQKEKKLEPEGPVTKPSIPTLDNKNCLEKGSSELKLNSASNVSSNKSSATELKEREEKIEAPVKSNNPDNHDVSENEKHQLDIKKCSEKTKPTTIDEKDSKPAISSIPSTGKDPETAIIDGKNEEADLSEIKNSPEDKKIENKEKLTEKEKDKLIKSNKSTGKIESTEKFSSKDLQKTEAVVDKPITAVETKPNPPVIAQNNPDKTVRKDETNNKISLESCNKKDSSDSEQNKKDEKQSVSAANEAEIIKTSKEEVITEIKKDVVPKESESPLIPVNPLENTATLEKSTKTSLPQSAANKKNAEDNIKDSAMSAQKEIVTSVTTPVKKVARLNKVTKSKPLKPAATELQDEKPTASSVRTKRKPKADSTFVLDSASSTSKDDDSDRKSKRHRLKTILYQSPLPELAYITKLSASEASNSPKPMSNEDRLIVFYKNEYMAVRNAEGTFYLCQTMQNVYRTSPRISIRWLSEDSKDNNVFIPDFYDHTDIECVLTTVELKRIDKGHLRLPKGERNRIESILKKAIDVEKGLVPRPELTAENPDGLDISLFKDESQIEKKSALTDGSDSLNPSIGSGRKPRRGVSTAASSARKSIGAASTPLASTRYKRNTTTPAKSSSLTKKRKTLVKRKRKIDHSDDDDDDETSDDCESDTEYKPNQKRSSLNISCISKTMPRAQRSPLAKARAASPITPTTSRSKNVPQKATPTPSTSKASRGERAAKRKSIVDAGSSEEALTPVKKPTTTSNNKSKGTLKKTKH